MQADARSQVDILTGHVWSRCGYFGWRDLETPYTLVANRSDR